MTLHNISFESMLTKEYARKPFFMRIILINCLVLFFFVWWATTLKIIFICFRVELSIFTVVMSVENIHFKNKIIFNILKHVDLKNKIFFLVEILRKICWYGANHWRLSQLLYLYDDSKKKLSHHSDYDPF